MPEIQLSDYYGLSATHFDDAKVLIQEIENELPEEWKNHRAVRTCLDTHDLDEAIAFMALAIGSTAEDVLSDTAHALHVRHKIRNELNGIADAAQLLPEHSFTREKVMAIMRQCIKLSYRE